MTPEETREAIKVMEHYANGGTVYAYSRLHPSAQPYPEFKLPYSPSWDWSACVFRIKREPREWVLDLRHDHALPYVGFGPQWPWEVRVREVIE